jgi:PTS system nitrogen regulatory IIA component
MEIKDFLAPAQVITDLRAADKARLLDELARRAAAALGLAPEAISTALRKREELGSTGTGGGVALPHARLPGIDRPFALLVRLARAIDFDAIDRQPVDLVCLLLLPAGAQAGQLNALACAARALRDADVLRKLRQASSSAEAYRALI